VEKEELLMQEEAWLADRLINFQRGFERFLAFFFSDFLVDT
jgi:hypothetical protein